MNKTIYFITHADVVKDPNVPVTQWGLSAKGRQRHELFNTTMSDANITEIYSSEEQKALDGATILSAHLDVPHNVVAALHENDRSATGYLPPTEFEHVADRFFERPDESIRGWEKASAAQHRIITTIDIIIENSATQGNTAIISHGAVGALLLCHLSGVPVTRTMDQPGTGGGNYFSFDSTTNKLHHSWRDIATPMQ